MAELQLGPMTVVKQADIPPQRRNYVRNRRSRYFEVVEALNRVPLGYALMLRHNAPSAQVVHARFKDFARRHRIDVKVVVRGSFAFVWREDAAPEGE